MIMDRFVPTLGITMFHYCFSSLINTNTNDLDLVSPVFFSFFKHGLVVSHWCLAWWTPSSPEVNEPNFTLSMVKSDRISSFNWNDILDWIILTSSTKLHTYFDCYTFDTLSCFGQSIFKFVNLLLLFRTEHFLNNHGE